MKGVYLPVCNPELWGVFSVALEKNNDAKKQSYMKNKRGIGCKKQSVTKNKCGPRCKKTIIYKKQLY